LCINDNVIGFAKGSGENAVQNIGRVDHASRHLIDVGILIGSKEVREAFKKLAIDKLEKPKATYTTKDSLGIFWLIEKPQPDGRIERFHEEVDGFTVNALWNQELPETLIDEIYNQLNQLLSENAMQVKIYPIFSDEYKNLCIDFRVIEWPQNWLPLLKKILKLPVNLGAIVSYVGIEGSFSWPGLFDPVEMENTVYAAYCPEMGFICHANLDEEIQYLSNKELNRLKRYMVSYARQNNRNSSMVDTTLLPNF